MAVIKGVGGELRRIIGEPQEERVIVRSGEKKEEKVELISKDDLDKAIPKPSKTVSCKGCKSCAEKDFELLQAVCEHLEPVMSCPERHFKVVPCWDTKTGQAVLYVSLTGAHEDDMTELTFKNCRDAIEFVRNAYRLIFTMWDA